MVHPVKVQRRLAEAERLSDQRNPGYQGGRHVEQRATLGRLAPEAGQHIEPPRRQRQAARKVRLARGDGEFAAQGQPARAGKLGGEFLDGPTLCARGRVQPDIAQRHRTQVEFGDVDAHRAGQARRGRQRQLGKQAHEFVWRRNLLGRRVARRHRQHPARDHRIEGTVLAQRHLGRTLKPGSCPILVGHQGVLGEQDPFRGRHDLAGDDEVALARVLGGVGAARCLPVGQGAVEARTLACSQQPFGAEREPIVRGSYKGRQLRATLCIDRRGREAHGVCGAAICALALEGKWPAQCLHPQLAGDRLDGDSLVGPGVGNDDLAVDDLRAGDRHVRGGDALGEPQSGVDLAVGPDRDLQHRLVEHEAGDEVAVAQEIDERELRLDVFDRDGRRPGLADQDVGEAKLRLRQQGELDISRDLHRFPEHLAGDRLHTIAIVPPLDEARYEIGGRDREDREHADDDVEPVEHGAVNLRRCRGV